ncbi:MAG: hypothetical protein JWL59_1557 [Chthoniobacteraceae bacterium]|nr:hypothetical protein [Chthoniobacteraceae bacterium]
MLRTFARRLSYLEEHHRLVICIGCALLAFICAMRLGLPMRMIIGWNGYAVAFLLLAWTRIITALPSTVIRVATLEHSSRKLVFTFVLTAACASLGAVAFLLGSAKDLPAAGRTGHVILAVSTVVLSWSVVHTLFTLQYAYLFYRRVGGKSSLGLQFPEEPKPDYLDFAYFSFVIGMTSQVSDVQISSRQIRRWALLHGVVSFGFNLAIVGLSINVISGLFS